MASGIDANTKNGARRRALVLALLVAGGAVAVVGLLHARRAMEVAVGYAAKLTCSMTLVSGRTAERVRSELLEHALGAAAGAISVQGADCCARANMLGLVSARAVHRRGIGCTLLAGREESELRSLEEMPPRPVPDPAAAWPLGDAPVEADALPPATRAAVEAAIDAAFAEPGDRVAGASATEDDAGGRVRQTRAVVVAHRGRLVAERYADGITASTPMVSWSMAKSVMATLVGLAAAEGLVDLDAPAPVPEWSNPADPRHAITPDQLLRMSSGLAFDETYGAVNDVSRMLFTQADTGAFAASFPAASAPDTAWSYSSGTTNILSRMLLALTGGDVDSFVRWSRSRLFDPAGLASAFFEHDAAGTPIGSSFAWMTARDWARFGELNLRDGVWNGRRLLPEGWVKRVTTPTPRAPLGRYGAHWWLNAGDAGSGASLDGGASGDGEAGAGASRDGSAAPDGEASVDRPWPLLPRDAYAARGYAGQWVLVVPSAELVVVRLGNAFPSDGDDGAEELGAALLRALGSGQPASPS